MVTAGGTREPLDPVRFLGNRSSGKQGYAFARAAAARGARVTLIAANVALPDPAGVDLIRVGTTEELRKATAGRRGRRRRGGDGRGAGRLPAGRLRLGKDQEVRRTAARPPSSWSPTRTSPPSSAAAAAPDSSWWSSPRRPHDAEATARAKLARKGADLIVVNEVGVDKVFGADTNAVTVLGADGVAWTCRRAAQGGPRRRRLGSRGRAGLSAACPDWMVSPD